MQTIKTNYLINKLFYTLTFLVLAASLLHSQDKPGPVGTLDKDTDKYNVSNNWNSFQVATGQWIPMHQNNDGKTDFVNVYNIPVNRTDGNNIFFQTFLSNGDGTWTKTDYYPTIKKPSNDPYFLDLDGNNLTDIIYIRSQKSGNFDVYTIQSFISQGEGNFTKSKVWFSTKRYDWDDRWYIGDVNGDKKQDLILMYTLDDKTQFYVFFSDGNGSWTGSPTNWNTNRSDSGEWQVLDYNGDGKTDILNNWDYYDKEIFTIYTSNGDGNWTAIPDWHTGKNPAGRWQPMDVNGDGKTDIVNLWDLDGTEYYTAYISLGNGSWDLKPNWSTGRNDSGAFEIMDVNGDGKIDIVNRWDYNGKETFSVYLSKGDGTWERTPDYISSHNPDGSWIILDVNGDGKADYVNLWVYNSGPQLFQTYFSEYK